MSPQMCTVIVVEHFQCVLSLRCTCYKQIITFYVWLWTNRFSSPSCLLCFLFCFLADNFVQNELRLTPSQKQFVAVVRIVFIISLLKHEWHTFKKQTPTNLSVPLNIRGADRKLFQQCLCHMEAVHVGCAKSAKSEWWMTSATISF